ncbi:MFS transporter [Pseudonocardia yuanmonensis]|uniref:MFS transporter n=1 Tax=Pseudonocardia yuanmonensis TaxID=1095914 RepID=A0ABP8W9H2_9PSEU
MSTRVMEERRAGGAAVLPPAPVAVLGLGSFAIGTDMFVLAGLLTRTAADLAVAPADAGLALAVYAGTYAIGAPVLGTLLGGRRLRPLLLGSIAAVGVAAVATALAPNLAVLLAARALAALAACVHVPAAAAAALAAVSPEKRGRAASVVPAGSSLAMVVGAPLGVVLAGVTSWRAAFALVAVLAAGAAVGLWRAGAGAADLARTTARERLRPLRSPALVGTLGVSALLMAGSQSVYAHVDLLLQGWAGVVLAVMGVGGLLGTWCGGIASDRWGGRRVVAVAAVALATALVAVTADLGGAGLVVAAAGWGAAAWACIPAQQHRLAALAAGPAPVVLALNGTAVHLGFAAGALLGGLALGAPGGGAGAVRLVVAACCGAGLLLHLVLLRRERS